MTSLNTALHCVPVETVFQLDGAPPHFPHCICVFPEHWIGTGGPIPWPPHSQKLTPLDFTFLEFVKDIIYCEKVQNVNELHNRIMRAVEYITNEMFDNSW
jgi:hypothetical protein